MSILEKLKHITPINEHLVSTLYGLAKRSLIIVLLLNISITFLLYSIIGNTILIWGVLFFVLILIRLYLLDQYHRYPRRYRLQQWYYSFVILALITAGFFGALAIIMIPYGDKIYLQLFITMILTGYASGSHPALSSDYRLGLSYTLFILIPLLISFLWQPITFYNTIAFFIFLLILSFSFIYYESHKQFIILQSQTEKLNYLATHDTLTKLLNRRGFIQQLKSSLFSIEKAQYYSILFYLDLNQFKVINDTLGHDVGDRTLQKVGNRLRKMSHHYYNIGRLGGDEFALFLNHVSDNKIEAEHVARKCLQEIKDIFQEPFSVEGMSLRIRASIGVLILDPKDKDIEIILRHADLSMYHAKTDKSNTAFYDVSFARAQKELFALQHDLSYALDKQELQLYMQPIVDINDNHLYAAETLLRWHHPVKGILSPDTFIPLLIKAGLLAKVSWWIIEEVCKTIHAWKEKGIHKLSYISININALQLSDEGFINQVQEILDRYSIDGESIVFEITERSLIDNFSKTESVIAKLRTLGVVCAIDDFGTGYSSLSYLQKLSCKILKIDRSFVAHIDNERKELALLATILHLGKEFGYNIVIEGVETEEQKNILFSLDKDLHYQGYLYSRPKAIKDFEKEYLD